MTKNTVIDDAKSMASTLRSVRMMRPAEAIEKLIEAYLAQEARIAELTKDAEPAPAPAPKAITADMVTDEMLDAYFALDGLDDWRELATSLIGDAKKQCAEIVNAFNGVKP